MIDRAPAGVPAPPDEDGHGDTEGDRPNGHEEADVVKPVIAWTRRTAKAKL